MHHALGYEIKHTEMLYILLQRNETYSQLLLETSFLALIVLLETYSILYMI